MRIAIVHDRITSASDPDARDVLIQTESVREGLTSLGHETMVLACDLNLDRTLHTLRDFRTAMVFNLVESIEGHGRLIHLFPFCLDAVGLPYTGAPAEAMMTTSNKTAAKTRLRGAGLATPDWVGPFPSASTAGLYADKNPADWIIKSVWEHASIGLDENAIIRNHTAAEAAALLPERAGALGNACFGERFIEGREFNLSLLGGNAGPMVLPPAEILFKDYEPQKPRIVDYRAKWDEGSFEFHHTSRSFEFTIADGPLLNKLIGSALECWKIFGLRGYARVDFRVDDQGRPWILEINANPCLSPDAGFAAALAQAGLTFREALRRIMEDIANGCRPQPLEEHPRAFIKNLVAGSSHDDTAGQPPQIHIKNLILREEPDSTDPGRVRQLVALTGFFSFDEEVVAGELVQERLDKGAAGGYHFVFAEQAGRLVGYTCFGPVPCTESSYDLYWIAVHPDLQGQGMGRYLLLASERRIRAAGGKRIYADTSQREQYAGTRAFYERNGYHMEIILTDFYAPGDGKVIYCKTLPMAAETER